MSEKHTPQTRISKDLVHELNEKYGWFQYADAQSDVSNAFANEAIERYEMIRSAAPALLTSSQGALRMVEWYADYIKSAKPEDIERHPYLPELEEIADELRAAIAKALGEDSK